MDVEYKRL